MTTSRRRTAAVPSTYARARMIDVGRRAEEGMVPDLEVEGWTVKVPSGSRRHMEWIFRPEQGEAWLALMQLRWFREELDRVERLFVAQARAEGFDWEMIAAAMGSTRPTVARKFGDVDDEPAVQAFWEVVQEQLRLLRSGETPPGPRVLP